MLFVLNDVAGLSQVASLPGFEDATADTVTAILEEAGKFATEVLDPLNATGDREGSKLLPDGTVRTPAGFKAAYRQYIENGWNGLTKPSEYGGQHLPQLVATPIEEMWHAANMYNNGKGGQANHRYLTSHSEVGAMLGQGWIVEGPVFCTPP